jgi:4-hydroxy-tetrahydrodipicolinate synthase
MVWGKVRGVFPPVVTPLDAGERLDEAGFERQIERLLEAGVHGLYLLGSSGEWASLSDETRWRTVRAALRIVDGRVPIICCVMDTSTSRVVENARRARDLGVEAVAATPPYYYPPFGNEDIVAFFEQVARLTGVPVFIYNIPSTTKVNVPAGVLAQLADVPGIAGVKESSGNWAQAMELLDAVAGRDEFSVFIGSHVVAGGALLFGASGAIMSLANLDPATCCRLYDAAMKPDIEELRRCQRRLMRLGQIYRYGREVPCLKTALELMGVCASHATHPLLPLSSAGREAVADILRSLDLL